MNGRFQMQGGKNLFLPKEMNANRFFWDSHWLEIWSKNHFCPSMGPNGGSVATDSGLKCHARGGTTETTFHYCWRVKSSFELVGNWFEWNLPATHLSLLPLVISSRVMFYACVRLGTEQQKEQRGRPKRNRGNAPNNKFVPRSQKNLYVC
jgi:hypothetical protein